MAYQLIYTSYPQSLVHGRTGFSTVARCGEMSERLVAEIERASQYDISSGTVYAHRRISVGAETYHVLTRTKDCGSDYTNRNNYVAHHIVLTAGEAAKCALNPADIMLNYPDWCSAFTGAPRFLPEIDARQFDKYQASTLPAQTWRKIFGDCAHAAALGDSAQIRARVGDADLLLKLFAETLLLARLKRADWDTTFTTRLLPSEKPSDFNWSASDNPENADADLISRRANTPPSGRRAEYARTGVAKNSELLNLSVSQEALNKRRFNVVETSRAGRSPIYAGAVLGAAILAAAITYALVSPSGKAPNAPRPAPSAPIGDIPQVSAPRPAAAPAPKAEAKIPLMRALANAREKINAGDFAEAMAYWDEHSGEAREKYRGDLLDDIRSKIKSMLRYAENVSLNPNRAEAERAKALRNLEIIESSPTFTPPETAKFLPQKIEELRRILKSK